MPTWIGSARSNFARFEDLEKLEEVCARAGVKVVRGPENFARLCVAGSTDDGDFPSVAEDDDGNEAEFIGELVAPLLVPGSVLVVMHTGAEAGRGDEVRYVSGGAAAYLRDEAGQIRIEQVTLNDIYEKAAQAFRVEERDIGECTYEDLPKSVQAEAECAPTPRC